MIRRAHATSWRDCRHARSRSCPAKMCTPQKKPWGDSRRRLSGGATPDVLSVVTMLLAVALTSACRIDMHVQPRVNPLAKSDFFPDQRGARPLVEGTAAWGQLLLHREKRQHARRLHALSPDQRSSRTWTRTLRHLLRSLSLAGWRWQRIHSVARILPQAPVFPRPAASESCTGILLRRDQQRLWHHARLLRADSAAGSLDHRRLRACAAIESERNQSRRSSRTESALGPAGVSRGTGLGCDSSGDGA